MILKRINLVNISVYQLYKTKTGFVVLRKRKIKLFHFAKCFFVIATGNGSLALLILSLFSAVSRKNKVQQIGAYAHLFRSTILLCCSFQYPFYRLLYLQGRGSSVVTKFSSVL